MFIKKKSSSSSRWLHRHFNDKYVKKAKQNKLRSRAWFKLAEIQNIDNIFYPGIKVLDLGAAPGSWSQYVITQIGKLGSIIACDIRPMKPMLGLYFIKGDLQDPKIIKIILDKIGKNKVQIVLSDMAPTMSGIVLSDISKSMHLAELALNICKKVLSLDGSFLVKVFQGELFEQYVNKIKYIFKKIKIRKPDASRKNSRELYIVATGYKI